jgi:hypothetical protein
VPAAVLKGIEDVRVSGLVNMLDRATVCQIALLLGYGDTADWIQAHPSEYAEGVFRGFTSETRPLP